MKSFHIEIKRLYRCLAKIVAVVILFNSPQYVNAALTCATMLSATRPPENVSLLSWEGQVSLAQSRAEFDSLNSLSYTYTTKSDEAKYNNLAQQVVSRLSFKEKNALKDYTQMSGSYHEILNSSLSDGRTIRKTKERREQIKNLLSAFEKGVVLPQGLLLFRGIGPGAEVNIGRVGQSIIWNRFTSTSMNPETARYFTQRGLNSSRTYIMVIEIAGPVRALLSNDPREMEFLLPPGLRYDITFRKFDRTENITIVHAKVFPNE